METWCTASGCMRASLAYRSWLRSVVTSGGRMSDDWARPVVHWEIEAVDPERQRAFYAALFNWDIGDGPIMSIPAGLGGPEPGPAGHLRASDRSGVNLYVQVRDLGESLRRVGELGGT